MTINPADCQTMTDVRAGVDEIDRRIVALIARRFIYMDAAARIKPDRAAVRDEGRKADVRPGSMQRRSKRESTGR